MLSLLVVVVLACFSLIRGQEVCCPDLGCFSSGGYFEHLPAPKCPEEWGGVIMGLFSRTNRDEPTIITRDSPMVSKEWFNYNKKTIVVVHGYQNDFNTEFKHDIKDALLEQEDVNVILVCWGGRAKAKWYPNAATATRVVGADVALRIDKFKQMGLKTEQLWCIGFSLGAHTCGFLGRYTALHRITGLDPAGPWFDKYHESTRLNKHCAARVEVIHTDGDGYGAYYGTLLPMGDIDFYVNGGKSQPGCWTSSLEDRSDSWDGHTTAYASLSCSHGRAYQYFIETIVKPGCHVAARRCLDSERLGGEHETCISCKPGGCPAMGYKADVDSLTGIYYLETRAKEPYCLQ